MNIWANAVVTNKGLALQAKLISGATMAITRAVTGTGTVDASLLQQQTAVSGEKQAMTFRPVSYPETGKCSVPVYLTNEALTTGYTIMQIGIYANDPDEGEILYFLCQAESGTGTPVPSVYENPGFSAEWNFTFQYGQADNVSVTVDPANTVTRAEMNEKIAAETANRLLSNLPNPAKATGNLLYRGNIITSNAQSADKYTSIGIYKVYLDGASGSDFNFPTPYGIFVVNASIDGTSYDYVSQMFYAMGNSKIFSRSSSDKGTTWTEWSQAAANTDLTNHASNKKNPHNVTCEQLGAVPSAKSLVKGTDLNTVVSSGFYRINEEPVNGPGYVAYAQMLVVRGGNDTVAQMVFPYGATRMYIRTGNPTEAGGTGAWKEWAEVYTSQRKPSPDEIGAIPKTEQFAAVMTTTSFSNEEQINVFYDDYSADFAQRTKYEALVFHNISHSILGGGLYYLSGLKNNEEYEWQEARSYVSGGPITCFARSKITGVWTPWVKISSPAYSYGTSDLTAGTSELETGKLYFVYE